VKIIKLSRCHGDRFVPARFGPVGGLSQPRRDTADPKQSKKPYFYLFTFYSTPCDRAIFSIVEIYPIYNRKATLFQKNMPRPQNPPKNTKNRRKTILPYYK